MACVSKGAHYAIVGSLASAPDPLQEDPTLREELATKSHEPVIAPNRRLLRTWCNHI